MNYYMREPYEEIDDDSDEEEDLDLRKEKRW